MSMYDPPHPGEFIREVYKDTAVIEQPKSDKP